MTSSPTFVRGFTPRRRPNFRPRAEALEGRQLLSAGNLDSTFGSGAGFVLTSPRVETNRAASRDEATAVQVLSDGSVLAAGSSVLSGSTGDFGLVRLTSTGSLDPAFGSGGRVATDFFQGNDSAWVMAVDANGNIVVAGGATRSTKVGKTTTTDQDFGVARYLPNGTLDPSFAGGGKVATNLSAYSSGDANNRADSARAVAIQPDGKVLVGGQTQTGSSTTVAAMVRYKVDGSLDTSFGVGGKLITNLSGQVRELVVLPGGSILVLGGDPDGHDFVARLDTGGNLDPTFGPNGSGVSYVNAATSVTVRMTDFTTLADGSIVAGGYTLPTGTGDLALARFTSGGILDPTFGAGGVVIAPNKGAGESASEILVQADGKILVAGQYVTPTYYDTLVARFLSDGSLDTSFGNGGTVVHSFNSASTVEYCNAAALQADGKLVTVGSIPDRFGTYDFLVARFLGDSAPLLASAVAPTPVHQTLTVSQARPAQAEALAYWRSRNENTSRLGRVDLVIADLGDNRLGEASGSTITLDGNAAGWGWNLGRSRRALGRMNLRSALKHEVGHRLGHDHAEGGVMSETLSPDVRRFPPTAS